MRAKPFIPPNCRRRPVPILITTRRVAINLANCNFSSLLKRSGHPHKRSLGCRLKSRIVALADYLLEGKGSGVDSVQDIPDGKFVAAIDSRPPRGCRPNRHPLSRRAPFRTVAAIVPISAPPIPWRTPSAMVPLPPSMVRGVSRLHADSRPIVTSAALPPHPPPSSTTNHRPTGDSIRRAASSLPPVPPDAH